MDSEMKKRVKRVVWDRWYYLLFEKDIHIIVKLAAVPMMVSVRLTELLYRVYLKLTGVF